MNIDYEAIAKEAMCIMDRSQQYTNAAHAAAVIEAYEAQKAPPEWVPLDLATVKQGQEVRQSTWEAHIDVHRFVATYDGDMIVEANGNVERYAVRGFKWLMRAPKPKTVRVQVRKGPNNATEVWIAGTWRDDMDRQWKLIGEGDIPVKL